jgi:hypothetical protein
MRVVNPTFGLTETIDRAAVTRLPSATDNVRFLSNAKPNATELLSGLAGALGRGDGPVFAKSDPSRGAAPELLDEIAAGGSVALVAIGD